MRRKAMVSDLQRSKPTYPPTVATSLAPRTRRHGWRRAAVHLLKIEKLSDSQTTAPMIAPAITSPTAAKMARPTKNNTGPKLRSADSEISATTKPTKPTRALIPGPSSAICVSAEVSGPVMPVKATRSSAWLASASPARASASRQKKAVSRRVGERREPREGAERTAMLMANSLADEESDRWTAGRSPGDRSWLHRVKPARWSPRALGVDAAAPAQGWHRPMGAGRVVGHHGAASGSDADQVISTRRFERRPSEVSLSAA